MEQLIKQHLLILHSTETPFNHEKDIIFTFYPSIGIYRAD